MRSRLSFILPAGLLATVAVAMSGCGSGGPGDFTLIQEKPEIIQVDNGGRGSSKGDQTHFEAKVTRDGEAAGLVFGQLTLRGLPGRFGRAGDYRIDESMLLFQLKDGDIFALGVAEYPRTTWKLAARKPARRAIIGGTGEYAGARGELITTRRPDGTYEQQFEFSD